MKTLKQSSIKSTSVQSASRNEDANDSQGVGGRHENRSHPHQGGGYPDICSDFGAAVGTVASGADPRLEELRRIGLPRVWMAVALQLGFDAFMRLWQVLMREGHVDDRNRVVVPNYSRYLRFQRNQLIRELDEEGLSADEIRLHLRKVTGQALDITHIRRTMRPRSAVTTLPSP